MKGIHQEYIGIIQEKFNYWVAGDLGQYYNIYLVQFENFLQTISACQWEVWEGYLAALECDINPLVPDVH